MLKLLQQFVEKLLRLASWVRAVLEIRRREAADLHIHSGFCALPAPNPPSLVTFFSKLLSSGMWPKFRSIRAMGITPLFR